MKCVQGVDLPETISDPKKGPGTNTVSLAGRKPKSFWVGAVATGFQGGVNIISENKMRQRRQNETRKEKKESGIILSRARYMDCGIYNLTVTENRVPSG